MHHPPCTCHACGEKPSRPCPPPCSPPAPDCGCRPSPPCPPPCPPPAPDCGCRPHRPCPPPCPPPAPDCGCRPHRPCPPPCPPPAPDCGCRPPRPCKPCKPGKPEGVLLQKILSCDRLSISCLCVDLALSGLDCARPPLTLMSVHESGAQPSWTPLGEPDCAGRVMVRVTVPVCAQVSDACGQRFAATGQVDAEVCLRLPGACHGYYSLFLLPCVRLLCADGCAEGAGVPRAAAGGAGRIRRPAGAVHAAPPGARLPGPAALSAAHHTGSALLATMPSRPGPVWMASTGLTDMM